MGCGRVAIVSSARRGPERCDRRLADRDPVASATSSRSRSRWIVVGADRALLPG